MEMHIQNLMIQLINMKDLLNKWKIGKKVMMKQI